VDEAPAPDAAAAASHVCLQRLRDRPWDLLLRLAATPRADAAGENPS
jgi:hypothetical protein